MSRGSVHPVNPVARVGPEALEAPGELAVPEVSGRRGGPEGRKAPRGSEGLDGPMGLGAPVSSERSVNPVT